MKKSYISVLLLMVSGLASAVSLESVSLENAVFQADGIAHVRVKEGRALFFDLGEADQVDPCLGIYKAEVLNVLKGQIVHEEFGVNFNLMLTPGSEYLLFFDNSGGLGIEYSMFEPKQYQQCIEGRPAVMARWRSSSLVEWGMSNQSNWARMATVPYGVYIENLEITDDAKIDFEEYVQRIESIVADQAENGFRRDPGGQ